MSLHASPLQWINPPPCKSRITPREADDRFCGVILYTFTLSIVTISVPEASSGSIVVSIFRSPAPAASIMVCQAVLSERGGYTVSGAVAWRVACAAGLRWEGIVRVREGTIVVPFGGGVDSAILLFGGFETSGIKMMSCLVYFSVSFCEAEVGISMYLVLLVTSSRKSWSSTASRVREVRIQLNSKPSM